MALLSPGAFPDTAFPSRGWMEDSFPAYGTAAAAVAVPHGVWIKRRRLPPELLRAIKKYLEVKVNA